MGAAISVHGKAVRGMQVDVDGVRVAIMKAARSNWDWSRSGVRSFCSELGWNVESEQESGANLRTGIGTGSGIAYLLADNATVDRIVLQVNEKIDNNDTAGVTKLSEIFRELVNRLNSALGIPASGKFVDNQYRRWDLPSLVVVILMADGLIGAELVNPEVKRQEDEWDDSLEGERDATFYMVRNDYTDSETDVWDRFASDLAQFLSVHLSSSTFVLVDDEKGRPCAQFSGKNGRLVADVMDSTISHGQEDWLSPADREVMAEAGWTPHPDGGPFWQMKVEWSGDLETCQILTSHTVTVLRDILRRASPPPTVKSHIYHGYYGN